MLKVVNPGWLAALKLQSPDGALYRITALAPTDGDVRVTLAPAGAQQARSLTSTLRRICTADPVWTPASEPSRDSLARFLEAVSQKLDRTIRALPGELFSAEAAELAQCIQLPEAMNPDCLALLPLSEGPVSCRAILARWLAEDRQLWHAAPAGFLGQWSLNINPNRRAAGSFWDELIRAATTAANRACRMSEAWDFAPYLGAAAERHLQQSLPEHVRVCAHVQVGGPASKRSARRRLILSASATGEATFDVPLAAIEARPGERTRRECHLRVVIAGASEEPLLRSLRHWQRFAELLNDFCFALDAFLERYPLWSADVPLMGAAPPGPDLNEMSLEQFQEWWSAMLHRPGPATGRHLRMLADFLRHQSARDNKRRWAAQRLSHDLADWVRAADLAGLATIATIAALVHAELDSKALRTCAALLCKSVTARNFEATHSAALAPVWKNLRELCKPLGATGAGGLAAVADHLVTSAVVASVRRAAHSPAAERHAKQWLDFLSTDVLPAAVYSQDESLVPKLYARVFGQLTGCLASASPPAALAEHLLRALANLAKQGRNHADARVLGAMGKLRLPNGAPAASLPEYRTAFLAGLGVLLAKADKAKRDQAIHQALRAIPALATGSEPPDWFHTYTQACNELRTLGVNIEGI